MYNFKKTELEFKNIGGKNNYHFYLDDSRNDYSRLLETFKKGAFIISGCRSGFDGNTAIAIKQQLDKFDVEYTNEEMLSLKNNCEVSSGIYKHLLARYNATTTKNLEHDLRQMGYGFRASVGGFREKGRESQNEFSFVVPYTPKVTVEQFFTDCVSLVKKYEQDSGMFMHPDINDGKPFWINENSNVEATFNKKPRISSETDYYTRTKKSHSPAFGFDMEDSKPLTLDELAKSISEYRLEITRPNDKLRLIYNPHGWHEEKED